MASDSASPQDTYLVYYPCKESAEPYPIPVRRDALVQDLFNKIYEHHNIAVAIQQKVVHLYKCNLDVDPFTTLYRRSWYLLDSRSLGERMLAMHPLSLYFKQGPVRSEPQKIHVMVVTEDFLDEPCQSAKLEKKKKIFDGEYIDSKVEEAMKKLDAGLRTYVTGEPWKDFWTAPESASPEVAVFLNNLKIPCVQTHPGPVLLLHDLGGSVVDPNIVDQLFEPKSQILVNTSGSGKTRLLFEGLCKHWGFYFTTVEGSGDYGIGSSDVFDAISSIPTLTGFTRRGANEDSRDLTGVYDNNKRIAEAHMLRVLVARVLYLRHFLKIVQQTSPQTPVNRFRKHWLFLQLFPNTILGGDIFGSIVSTLSRDYRYDLDFNGLTIQWLMNTIENEFSLDGRLFIVLDEAQMAVKQLNHCFRSQSHPDISRPILTPIINSWMQARRPFILSGTGLASDLANDVLQSSILKPAGFQTTTETGVFMDHDRQREYIKRYMPPCIADSDSTKELFEQIWQYARGRHRFTASLLGFLLQDAFQSPHKILESFIKSASGFLLSNSSQYSSREPKPAFSVTGRLTRAFNFAKIRNDPDKLDIISSVVFDWLLEGHLKPLTRPDKQLVEQGFARFSDKVGDEVIIDEPLVLLASITQLKCAPWFSLEGSARKKLENANGRGENFEIFVAYYLACAFGPNTRLCDVFDFGPDVPLWAQQDAELVSARKKNGVWEFSPYGLQEPRGVVTRIGKKSTTYIETVAWLKDPTSVMCFPDINMGPDIVLFIHLKSGEVLAVVVQVKWRNKEHSGVGTRLSAKESLDPLRFYSSQNVSTKTRDMLQKSISTELKSLNEKFAIDAKDWFPGGLPVLKVIASHQAEPGDEPYHTTLKTDKVKQMIDKDGLLGVIKDTLASDVEKRKARDDDDGGDGDGASKKRGKKRHKLEDMT